MAKRKAKSKVKGANVDRIRRLFVTASNPNNAQSTRTRARNELYKIAEQQRSVANSRIKSLRQQEYAYGNAYDNAQQFIEAQYGDNAKSFYKLKNDPKSLNAIYTQALATNAFISSKESTVRYQKTVEQKRFETFRNRPDFAAIFGDKDDNELREFLKYMGNQYVGQYLQFFDASADELEKIVDMFDSDTKRERMTALFKEFEDYYKDVYEHGVDPKDARGISTSELREELKKLYESSEKRRR